MSAPVYVGELEELIFSMVEVVGADAYGVSITRELEAQTGRVIMISSAHAALHRLEEKGFLKSKMGGASSARGGRRKRLFQITAFGRRALGDLRDMRYSTWVQLPNYLND
ncbi:MAG TPA: PadR family transcriptional regulator [Chryseosolibacter sp.]|nr:PadR family transcriptional regulator [Chryseosolibacter sp.]